MILNEFNEDKILKIIHQSLKGILFLKRFFKHAIFWGRFLKMYCNLFLG
jgi:hypothetical protein